MTAKLVRLKLPPKLLAHIRTLEVRRHLGVEILMFSSELPRYDEDKLLDNLVFLLNSPLFLYAITARFRRANLHGHDYSPASVTDNLVSSAIDIYNLHLTTLYENDGWITKLHYGDVSLIEVREPNVEQNAGCRQSVRWFCDEVEFLACEFRARDEAAAVILGHEVAKNVKSKIVRLKVGRRALVAKRRAERDDGHKRKRLKLKLRLWK